MTTQPLHLPSFAQFPATADAQWRVAAVAALKGAAFEQLVSHSHGGAVLQPLYARREGEGARALRQKPGPWQIAARLDHPDPAGANALALADLEGGAGALAVVFAGARGSYGFGIPADGLDAALERVELDLIGLRLDSPGDGLAPGRALRQLAARRGLAPGTLDFAFGCDPLCAEAAVFASELADQGHAGRAFLADGRAAHNAGAGEAQELAFVLANALHALRQMERQGLPLADASAQIAFLLAADADQLLGIAKFRALRQLWARIEEVCGLAPRPARVHAETSWRMMTQQDPHVNALRANIGIFAAAIGGADAIAALPFTQALGLPDAFARRLARNSQLVLLEEAHLAKVADPAAGSGGLEALTEALCAQAWDLLQHIEKAGGIAATLEGAWWPDEIARVAASRARAIAARRDALTGVSSFAQLHEPRIPVLLPLPAGTPSRRSATFEALRARAAALGSPRIALACIGPRAAFAAQAQFAAGVFAAGGIEAFECVGAAQVLESGAALACICGSGEGNAAEAEALALALPGKWLMLAGRPGALDSPLRAAGVARFVFAGCDVVAALDAAIGALEAAESKKADQ